MIIPKQLQKDDFKFVLVNTKSKRAFEKEWTTKNNYDYNSEKLIMHLEQGGNYGVLCGVNNLLVLDFDDIDTYEEVKDKLPKTLTIKTGRGGFHNYYYCNNTKSLKILDKDKKTLVDIQGNGKMVIGANSTHENGNKYLVFEDLPIEHISGEEIEKIFEKWLKKDKFDEQKNTNLKENPSTDINFIKNRVKISELLKHYGLDVTKNPTYCKWHGANGAGNFSFNDEQGVWHCFHCEKGGDIFSFVIEEEKTDFRRAVNILKNYAGIHFNQKNNEKITAEDLMNKQKAEEILKSIKSLEKFMEDGVPKVNWLVENTIKEAGITIFGGPAGSFKTWCSMQLALACATGTPFIEEFKTNKCDVLYIDEENGQTGLINKFSRIIKGHGLSEKIPNIHISFLNGITLDTEEGRTILDLIIEEKNPKLVIIDSAVRCMTGEEDKSKDVKMIFATLKKYLKERQISFVLIHHTKKGDSSGLTGLRGSGDFGAFADVVLMFNTVENIITVSMAKNRYIDCKSVGTYIVKVHDGEDSIRFEYNGEKKKPISALDSCLISLREWIKDKTLFKTREAEEDMKLLGHKKNAISDSLQYLVETSELVKIKQGVYNNSLNESK